MRKNTHKTKLQKSKTRISELRKRKTNAKKHAEIKKLADERAVERNKLRAERHAAHMESVAKKWLAKNQPESPDAA